MLELTLQEIADAVGGILQGEDPGKSVRQVSTDTRTLQPGDLYWALEGDRFDGHDFCSEALEKGAVAVVIRSEKLPGIEVPSIRVSDTLFALGELARCIRERLNARVIGITGSVGKTTAKEFTRKALEPFGPTKATQGNLNNLIGVPKTLFGVEKEDHWLVLEMGTDRPGEIRRLTEIGQPEIGMITAIGESHLEKLGSVEKVFEEKSDLLRGLPERGTAIIPNESKFRDRLREETPARTVTFGTEKEADFVAVDPRLRTRGCYGFALETPVGRSEVQLQVAGLHQVLAATAAAAAAVSLGLKLEGIVEGLQSFTGLPGRCEILELRDGTTLIADHYNANPVSMAAAQRLLETFVERRKVMIAGEMWDLGERSGEFHRQVGERIGSGRVDLLIGVGPKTRGLIAAAQDAGMPKERTRWYESTEKVCRRIEKELLPGDVVLIKGSRGMHLERVVSTLRQGEGES